MIARSLHPALALLLLLPCACGNTSDMHAVSETRHDAWHAQPSHADADHAPHWGRLDASSPGFGSAWEIHVGRHADGTPHLFAHIDADGTVRLLDPPALPDFSERAATVGDMWDGCLGEALALDNAAARIEYLPLYAVQPGEGKPYRVLIATSRSYAEWNAGERREFDSGAATLDMHLAESRASVRGLCRLFSEDVIEHDLHIVPGLNLVRSRFDRFGPVGREPGSAAALREAGITLNSEPVFPDDMRWFLIDDLRGLRSE